MRTEEDLARFKEDAARRAVADEVRDGMIVGLGTGSTVAFVLRELARRVRDERWRIQGVPTSERTAAEARRLGIPLVTLDAVPDVVVDGADQVDPSLDLVKGGGGALVREKIVALAARRLAIVGDYTKAVPRLRGPVPLEVLPFALPWILRVLPDRIPGSRPQVRVQDRRPSLSDNGNVLVDLACGPLADPAAAAAVLDGISGVVDHGLFIGIAAVAYLAGPEGVRRLARGTA
jgi:ribose 5-phosphate isomerase A